MYMRGTRGKNLICVGWENGTLRAEFKGGRAYEYSGVPEEEYKKLTYVPFPDKLFSTNIAGKYPSKQVAGPLPKAKKATQETQGGLF